MREAVEGLCAFGIFEKSGNGVYVQDYKDKILSESMNVLVGVQNVTADELIEARIVAETQIVKIAAKKATPEDIEELKQIIAETEAAGSQAAARKLSARFHRKLADMTKNPILINMFCTIYDQIDRFERKNYNTIKNHQDVLDAIREGNPEKAEQAMALHLLHIRDAING